MFVECAKESGTATQRGPGVYDWSPSFVESAHLDQWFAGCVLLVDVFVFDGGCASLECPRAVWRRWRLWKTSRYSKTAFASSIRVLQRLRSSSSTCIRAQNDSIMALSKQSPTVPIDGTSPDWWAR